MRQLPLSVRLPDTARFSGFVPGPNREVLELLSSRSGQESKVVWLWGPAGSGKTHLLQAACAATGESGRTATFVDASNAQSPALLEGCEQLDLVCLDGLDIIAGDPDWNTAVFRLHTLMRDSGARLLLASRSAPKALTFRLPDLGSRMMAASIHQLQELDESGKVAALCLRARRRGLELSDEAALYLLHHLPRDMHSLCGSLDRLDEASLAAQRRLTVPFLRQALAVHSAAAGADGRVARK